jgi:hypothetical protein
LADFPRNDGFYLLQKLKSKLKVITTFHQSLVAEKAGNFSSAKSFYENAKSFLLDPKDCQICLGLVAIKMQDWENALARSLSLGISRSPIYGRIGNIRNASQ